MTSSLYVPGKLADCENVIVDVGTGYFVEKASASDAISRWYLHGKELADAFILPRLEFTVDGGRYKDVAREGGIPHQEP